MRLLRARVGRCCRTGGASETFRDLATRVLGARTYRAFVAKTGFSDYECADAVDTLYNYGFDDTIPGYTALCVDWAAPGRGAREA